MDTEHSVASKESVDQPPSPERDQQIKIQVPDAAIINELRGELEQANHDRRLLRLALGQAHEELAQMRVQFDGFVKTIEKQSKGKKSKTKMQQEAPAKKKGKKK